MICFWLNIIKRQISTAFFNLVKFFSTLYFTFSWRGAFYLCRHALFWTCDYRQTLFICVILFLFFLLVGRHCSDHTETTKDLGYIQLGSSCRLPTLCGSCEYLNSLITTYQVVSMMSYVSFLKRLARSEIIERWIQRVLCGKNNHIHEYGAVFVCLCH